MNTRMHFSRIRTARRSSHLGGVLHQTPPRPRHSPGPGTPLGPGTSQEPSPPGPGTPPGPGSPQDQTPGPGIHPEPGTPQTSHTPSPSRPGTPTPVNRMTDRCKHITLSKTSFAGSNKRFPIFTAVNRLQCYPVQ